MEALENFCGDTFWDLNRTWYTETPDFTPCFENTVLVWFPCGFLFLLAPLDIFFSLQQPHSGRHGRRNSAWSLLSFLKSVICLLLFVCELYHLSSAIVNLVKDDEENQVEKVYPVQLYTPVIKGCTFVIALITIYFSRLKGVPSSGIQLTFWLLLTLCELISFRSHINQFNSETDSTLQFAVFMIYFPTTFIGFFLHCWADTSKEMDFQERIKLLPHTEDNEHRPCPELKSSFLSRILACWFDTLALRGYRKPLEFQDLWSLREEDTSRHLVPMFDDAWSKTIKKNSQVQNGEKKRLSILPALMSTSGALFVKSCILKFFPDMMVFISPQILSLLINFVYDAEAPMWRGYLYAATLFVSSFVISIANQQYGHMIWVTGMRIRTVLVSAVYKKALVLSNAAKKGSTVGEIVNLMIVDVQRVMDVIPYIPLVWSTPLQVIVALYFLYDKLGVAVFSGFAIMVIFFPINMYIATKVGDLQREQMKCKDNRVKMMNEILSGMKVLKLMAWETSFQDQVLKVREKEIKALKQAAYWNAVIYFLCSCAPFLVAIFTFTIYVLIDESNVLNADRAFVSLSYLSIISQPLSFLPTLIANFTQGLVSYQRLNDFMNMEEIDSSVVSHDQSEVDPVVVETASFSWCGKVPCLHNINLRVKEGSLVAIVGGVGSGKSSLLAAILGELEKVSGRVNTKGSVGFVSQQAWIQNATVRENITFGRSFSYSKYAKTIEACALKYDMENLEGGDQAEIGEKGINLSGGQKQRVSLARAVYANTDTYLFDDPLSSVDSHVAKHIFDEVLGPRGILKKKTRILVTHGFGFLNQVDHIVVLDGGRIVEQGTYQALNGYFSDLKQQNIDESDKEALDDPSSIQKVEEAFVKRLSKDNFGSTQRSRFYGKSLTEKESLFETKHKIIESEKAETESVKWSIYLHYFQKAGWSMTFSVFALYLFYQGFSVYGNMWLSQWSSEPLVNGTIPTKTRDKYLLVYGILGVSQTIFLFLAIIVMAIGTLKSAALFHSEMLHKVMRCPMFFFDITPIGRIVNRFAKDIDVADNMLPQNLRLWLNSFFQVVATIFVVSYNTPIFLVLVPPVAVIFHLIQRFYIRTSRQLKRLESITRSPIYSHFGETICGITTIRAYGEQDRFILESEKRVDANQMAYFPLFISNRWLAIRLEIVGNIIIFAAALLAVLGKESLNAGVVGLSVSYSMQITMALNYLVRYSCEVETNLVAVERMEEYMDLPQEAPWEIPEKRPKKDWPDRGEVIFDQFNCRYRDGLDLVLKDVTCRVESREKIGIVGRTRAGKTSLTLGLFQIIRATGGSITIDGVNIAHLGLHDVRGRITIIPQEPVLFSGTLRMNLDPFEQYCDLKLWHALELAHLSPIVRRLSGGLDHEIAEGGENFSVGQRQLVCLARALLRKTKILVLDEATAAVDLETDNLIRETIRTEFHHSTVLTIAHRLHTVLDSSRILVLDFGQVKEFDTPENLLRNEKSIFYSMAKDAGLSISNLE